MSSFLNSTGFQRRMLSKEDEDRVDEVEVRREDQDKINKFSRLHQKEISLKEELKKDKEDLEDVSNELELVDEDTKIPYRIGDTFISLCTPQVQEHLSILKTKNEEEVAELEDRLSNIGKEISDIKVELYARFGPSINLET